MKYTRSIVKDYDSLSAKLVGGAISAMLIALLFWWYNHVWTSHIIPYWKWLFIATTVMFVSHKWPKWLLNLVFGPPCVASIILQVLSWLSLVTLPIFP